MKRACGCFLSCKSKAHRTQLRSHVKIVAPRDTPVFFSLENPVWVFGIIRSGNQWSSLHLAICFVKIIIQRNECIKVYLHDIILYQSVCQGEISEKVIQLSKAALFSIRLFFYMSSLYLSFDNITRVVKGRNRKWFTMELNMWENARESAPVSTKSKQIRWHYFFTIHLRSWVRWNLASLRVTRSVLEDCRWLSTISLTSVHPAWNWREWVQLTSLCDVFDMSNSCDQTWANSLKTL
jgi:hypothetical protein